MGGYLSKQVHDFDMNIRGGRQRTINEYLFFRGIRVNRKFIRLATTTSALLTPPHVETFGAQKSIGTNTMMSGSSI